MLKYAIFCAIVAALSKAVWWAQVKALFYVAPVAAEAASILFALFTILTVLCVVLDALGLGPVRKRA